MFGVTYFFKIPGGVNYSIFSLFGKESNAYGRPLNLTTCTDSRKIAFRLPLSWG